MNLTIKMKPSIKPGRRNQLTQRYRWALGRLAWQQTRQAFAALAAWDQAARNQRRIERTTPIFLGVLAERTEPDGTRTVLSERRREFWPENPQPRVPSYNWDDPTLN